MKKILLSLIMLIMVFSTIGCKNKTKSETQTENPKVEMSLSNGMKIRVELYPDVAPITVTNFLKLVDENFYNGTIFHRVINNFMIQGGGFYLDGNYITPKSADKIKGEFSLNGVENNLKHVVGVISMARSDDMNSASSQFFICSNDETCESLNGSYAAFGMCMDQESINNVLAIASVQTAYLSASFANFPVEPISIIKIKRI